MKKFKLRSLLAAISMGAASIAASNAGAATITVSGTTITVDCNLPAGQQNCEGIVGGSFSLSGSGNGTVVTAGSAGSLSSASADLYALGSSPEIVEGKVIDVLLDGVLDNDVTGGVKTNAGGVDSLTFMSGAQYIAFKTGNPLGGGGSAKHFFLKLLGNQEITLIFDKNGQQGGGFSHYTEFGALPVSSVPLPAAGWMLIASLGGIAAMKRRKKA